MCFSGNSDLTAPKKNNFWFHQVDQVRNIKEKQIQKSIMVSFHYFDTFLLNVFSFWSPITFHH